MGRKKKDDNKEKKMILAAGLLIAVVLAVGGTQMSVGGKEYARKVKLLNVRGYEVDETIPWSGIEGYEEEVAQRFKNSVRIERREILEWTEFYTIFKDSQSNPVYDYSVHDGVHGSDDQYVIWFSTVYLRGSSQGRFITYYIFIDG